VCVCVYVCVYVYVCVCISWFIWWYYLSIHYSPRENDLFLEGTARCCHASEVHTRWTVTYHTSHITHHTSHITHHTSHITHHTSHITHTSHIIHTHIHTHTQHIDTCLLVVAKTMKFYGGTFVNHHRYTIDCTNYYCY